MELSQLDLDRNINRLRIHSVEFSELPDEELISLLEKTIQNIQGIAYYWATLSAEKKQILQKHKEGEEWLGGPFVSILTTQYYIEYLKGNSPLKEENYNKDTNSYKVFPNKFIESLTFPLLKAEIRFSKSMSFNQIEEFRGFNQRIGPSDNVTLVLGAGNVSSIPFLDTLFHLVAKRSAILLKLNPVNDYLLPVFEKVFAEFIDRGFISVVNGNLDTSRYLTKHRSIDAIHLTGSNFTYENIVYDRQLTDKERSVSTIPKVNKKPIFSELGNVTPIIIHPGKWSNSELKFQARKIATAKLNNSGFNCIAAQVIVLPKGWRSTEKLKKYIKFYLNKIGDTTSYYPGANESLDNLKTNNNYELVNESSCSTPFMTADLDVEEKYSSSEVWNTTLYFKELEYSDNESFADISINYVNNELWGNLGVSVLIKGSKKKNNQHTVNKYKNDLNYGTVAINEWSAIAFIIPTMPWGGYPGNKDNDIQSGQGYVHNAYFFESPLKGIVETNFRFSRFIDPPWFVNNKKAHRLFKNLTYYQANNSKINFIKLIFSTLI
jgi:aldehyde dehydrogenase (NAD(P)+)